MQRSFGLTFRVSSVPRSRDHRLLHERPRFVRRFEAIDLPDDSVLKLGPNAGVARLDVRGPWINRNAVRANHKRLVRRIGVSLHHPEFEDACGRGDEDE